MNRLQDKGGSAGFGRFQLQQGQFRWSVGFVSRLRALSLELQGTESGRAGRICIDVPWPEQSACPQGSMCSATISTICFGLTVVPI